MKRGDLIHAVAAGDYGKPRPHLIVQADDYLRLPSLTLLPLTSELRDAPALRITVEPTKANGLDRVSQVMVDKAVTVLRHRLRSIIGRLEREHMLAVDRALMVFLGLA